MTKTRISQPAPTVMIITSIACVIISAVCLTLMLNYNLCYGFFTLGVLSALLAFGAMKRYELSTELTLAFVARLGMCLFLTYKNDGDADNYAVYALQFTEMPLSVVFANIPTGAYLYSWLISFLFRVFGEHYMPVRAMNTAISMYCVYTATDIVDEIYKKPQVTKQAAIWMALFPNLIRFSAYFANREPMLMLFMLLYLKHSYLYYDRSKIQDLLMSIVFLIPTMILHTAMIAMIAVTVLIILSREGSSSNNMSNLISKTALAVITIGVFIFMLLNGVGTEKLNVGGGVELSAASISSLGNMSAAGRAAYLKGVSFANPVLTILFLPVRMIYFLYTPFVWMLRAVVDFVGFFDAALYVFMSAYTYIKIKSIWRKAQKTAQERFIIILFVTLIIVVAMFAAVTSNYGTAIRHRCKIMPLLLIIFADGLEKNNE